MGLSNEQLDWIVAEVVRRLRAMQPGPEEDASECSKLALADRVISMATLHGKLSGVSQLTVRNDAVITPLAADELRAAGICVQRQANRP